METSYLWSFRLITSLLVQESYMSLQIKFKSDHLSLKTGCLTLSITHVIKYVQQKFLIESLKCFELMKKNKVFIKHWGEERWSIYHGEMFV